VAIAPEVPRSKTRRKIPLRTSDGEDLYAVFVALGQGATCFTKPVRDARYRVSALVPAQSMIVAVQKIWIKGHWWVLMTNTLWMSMEDLIPLTVGDYNGRTRGLYSGVE
jgi:hypothetical protein